MESFHQLLQANHEAAEIVVTHAGFDSRAAERLLENAALAAQRLTPSEFSGLGTPAVDTVLDAAADAKNLAPLGNTARRPNSFESPPDTTYRTAIKQPLENLRKKVADGRFDLGDPATVKALKAAVVSADQAFAAILRSAGDQQNIMDAQEVFCENTAKALGSISFGD